MNKTPYNPQNDPLYYPLKKAVDNAIELLYAKKIQEMKTAQNDIKCDGCGFETKIWNAIDNWAIVDGLSYCRKCQKRLKIGWYAEKNDKK